MPAGAAPTSLQNTDIVTGTGPVASAGQRVDVQYTGVAWSTHRQFDSSWTRAGQPFSFTLGRGEVIRGWDQGVAGMHVGGRRQIVIPPELGYGARGAGADIGPNETLVFVVDLIGVH
ncbi:MAG: FKBP-type peptidyl-prolyl cis-trans isomerase [Deltaproteobacteria bacterium]